MRGDALPIQEITTATTTALGGQARVRKIDPPASSCDFRPSTSAVVTPARITLRDV